MPSRSSNPREGWPHVFLNGEDVRRVYEVGNGYNAWGINPNALELGKSPIEACLLGAMGELAACRFYGIPYEPVFEPDGGFDLKIGSGDRSWTANVKTTPYFLDPWLRVMDKLNKNCDAYVLVAVDFTSAFATMVGWIPQPEMSAKPLQKLRPDLPACRVAYPEELRPCRAPAAPQALA